MFKLLPFVQPIVQKPEDLLTENEQQQTNRFALKMTEMINQLSKQLAIHCPLID